MTLRRSNLWVRGGLALLAALLILPVAAAVAQTDSPPASQDGQGSISELQQSSELDPREERRLEFLFWAYTIIWILLALYLISLWMRLGKVRREMAGLESRLRSLEDTRRSPASS